MKPDQKIKFKERRDKFSRLRKQYCDAGRSFDLYYGTSVTKIVTEDGVSHKSGSFPPKEGMFIVKITNEVVKKRLDAGLYLPKNTDPSRMTSRTIMYNSDNIKRNAGLPCVSVDITACYLSTSFNLGIIDEKTYKMGMAKDREFKNARNVAIGSIGALILHEKYVEGKLVLSEKTRKFGATSRLDVIDTVWAMSQRIATKLGKDFLLFLTDCFFVPANRAEDICKYIEEEGYKWKMENCEFGGVERMHTSFDKSGNEMYTEKVTWRNVDKIEEKFHDFSHLHNMNF